MKTKRDIKRLIAALTYCAGLSGAMGATIFTQANQDGMVGRDWYSSPNYYWVDAASATVNAYHDGGNRWWHRGMIIFDISSLHGVTLNSGEATLNLYSFGFSGVQLQYYGATGAELTTAYGQAGGSFIANLPGDEGWKSFDVTSFVQSGIDASSNYIGFVLNATVNYGGGSIASSEDSSGRGAYLTAVPEPSSAMLACFGTVFGAAAYRSRRRHD